MRLYLQEQCGRKYNDIYRGIVLRHFQSVPCCKKAAIKADNQGLLCILNDRIIDSHRISSQQQNWTFYSLSLHHITATQILHSSYTSMIEPSLFEQEKPDKGHNGDSEIEKSKCHSEVYCLNSANKVMISCHNGVSLENEKLWPHR